jgi:hypothetical protein
MINFDDNCFAPVFGELGVAATLTVGTSEFGLTVIDETRRKTQTSSGVETRSVGPAAMVRMTELTANGLAPKDYVGAAITFNGRNWMVRSHEPQGSPNGEDVGLVRLFLKAI